MNWYWPLAFTLSSLGLGFMYFLLEAMKIEAEMEKERDREE